MKRQIQFFMSIKDEAAFSNQLLSRFPSVSFINDSLWDTSSPPLKASIDMCEARQVYLWDKVVIETIPVLQRSPGRYQGPITGLVVQYDRSWLIEGGSVMTSGRIAHGMDEDVPYYHEMKKFVDGVWQLLRSYCPRGSSLLEIDPISKEVVNPKVGGYLVGPDAISWCMSDSDHLLKDRPTKHYYRPTPGKLKH